MPEIAIRQSAPTAVQDSIPLPTKVPPLPDEVFDRFPSLRDWQESEDKWWTRAYQALQSGNQNISQNMTAANNNTRTLRISFNQFSAQITEELIVVADEIGAMAQRIVTVSAMAGVNSNIKVQTTAPSTPSANDYWIDNSDITLSVTYQWNGLAWVEVTDPIAFAGVADERTARVTADGFLSSKYTLTVIAGNVVTGMNITSSTGAGTDISSVIFRATDFQIYNSVTGVAMFVVSGTNVNLAGTLTVSTSGKVFTGTGTYANNNTPFYVDNISNFSLGSKLTWDGTTLTITGSITATTGTIGGWAIGASTISANNAVLDSAGQLVLGTSNDVVYLSATDGTYRIWIGNVAAASAAFSVTKAGALFSNSGTIGGFTIGSTTLSAGTGATTVSLSTVMTAGLSVGDPTGIRSVHRSGTGGTAASFYLYNASNALAGAFEVQSTHQGGRLALFNTAGTQSIDIDIDALVAKSTITFDGDTNLYRNAANTLKTDDAFISLSLSSVSLVLSGTATGTLTMNGIGATIEVTDGTVNARYGINNGTSRFTVGTTTAHDFELYTGNTLRWTLVNSDGSLKSNGGALQLGNAYTAAAMAPTGYLTVRDSTGTVYKLACQV